MKHFTSLKDFIIAAFCLIDDELKELEPKLPKRRGEKPSLSDSEIITMEIVGEFLKIDEDKLIHQYFKENWLSFFPKIPCRESFVRHAANLYSFKQLLQRCLAEKLGAYEDNVHIVDGFPIPTCKYVRARKSSLFKGEAAYGYCAAKDEKYYGFKGMLNISLNGVITGFSLTPANIDERDSVWDTLDNVKGLLLGDKGYLRPILKTELSEQGIDLQVPYRKNMKDKRPPFLVNMLKNCRRIIETVIGQLVDRFNIEKVKARNTWHLMSRISRKLLSHTVCLFLGKGSLQFSNLL